MGRKIIEIIMQTKKLSEMSLEELWEKFPIILKEYNPEYKEWYLAEQKKLTSLVGKQNIFRTSHIGSTAVVGLISKPTVDILLEINENAIPEIVIDKIKSCGYTVMSESYVPFLKIAFNKGYTENGFDDRVFHLHLRFLGDHNELYFRDYLKEHVDVAEKYGSLKLELLEKYKYNRDLYTEAKTDFVRDCTRKAREEWSGRYKP